MSMIHGAIPVISSPELTVVIWAVWCALCTFAKWEYVGGQPIRSKPGSCFPTDKAIAERAYCSIRSVKSSIAKLEALGYVKRVARYGRKNKGEKGEQRSNEYILFAVPQPKA